MSIIDRITDSKGNLDYSRVELDPSVVPVGTRVSLPNPDATFEAVDNSHKQAMMQTIDAIKVAMRKAVEQKKLLDQEHQQQVNVYQAQLNELRDKLEATYNIGMTSMMLLSIAKVQAGDYPQDTIPILPPNFKLGHETLDQLIQRVHAFPMFADNIDKGLCKVKPTRLQQLAEEKKMMIQTCPLHPPPQPQLQAQPQVQAFVFTEEEEKQLDELEMKAEGQLVDGEEDEDETGPMFTEEELKMMDEAPTMLEGGVKAEFQSPAPHGFKKRGGKGIVPPPILRREKGCKRKIRWDIKKDGTLDHEGPAKAQRRAQEACSSVQ